MNESESLYSFGNLILNEDQLEESFVTPVGSFKLKYLTPSEKTRLAGDVSNSLGNAPFESLLMADVNLAQATCHLDIAMIDKPKDFKNFKSFHITKVTFDLYKRYQDWIEKLEKEMDGMLKSEE